MSWQDGAHDGDGFGVFARRAALSSAAAIAVDARSGAGLTSNANGVLEPGETAAVEPAWANSGGGDATFTGAATSLTGPPGPSYTLGLIKELVRASAHNDLKTQLDLERDLQRKAGASRDYSEGDAAFKEKRPPRFEGR